MGATSDINKPKTIGLVLDFFNPQILDGARAYLDEHGAKLDARWSVRGDWTPKNPGWDGLIYGVVDDKDLQHRLGKWKMPKVSLMPEVKGDWEVIPDYYTCGMMAAKELVDADATSLFCPIISNRQIDVQFAHGARDFACRNAIPYDEIETDITSLKRLLNLLSKRILASPPRTGFCQPHAGVAYSIQKLLIEKGCRIPADTPMVVINKDVQRTHELASVPLTTIDLDDWHRGFVAAEIVHHHLTGRKPVEKRAVIPPKGVTRRASTGHVAKEDRVVAAALNHMRNHYLSPIGVADVVAATGASRRIVEMRFKQALNRGIHEELNRLRIEEAKRWILKKDTSITQIAEACGFSSIHYFSAAFKKQTGLSPKQYQKREVSQQDLG